MRCVFCYIWGFCVRGKRVRIYHLIGLSNKLCIVHCICAEEMVVGDRYLAKRN